MYKMKIGLIGGGYWGRNLIREFYKLGILKTVCDLDEEQLAKHRDTYKNLQITTKWSDLLEDKEITAICVSLPAELHYLYAKEALENGKDVFVEKPLSLKLEDCEDLIKEAKKNNKILMVGHLLQYHPAIEKIYEMINKDYIGKIKYIVSNRLNLGKIRMEENVLWSLAPHDISIVLKLMKNRMPNWIKCLGQSFISSRHDITSTIMKFNENTDEECYVQINVNWLNPFKEQKLVIVGTKGMISFDDIEKKLRYYSQYLYWDKGIPVVNKGEGEIVEYDTITALEKECKHFCECCEERKNAKTDGDEGLRVLKILNSAQKSLSDNGKLEKIESEKKYYIHESSYLDEGAKIGEGTKIWHFSHIMKCEIGKNCNIGQNVFIGNNVEIGNNCKIQNNVSVYDGVIAGDNVFFGPSCVLTNDKIPRCEFPKNGNYLKTIIEDGATIGANSTIVCGTKIGKYSLIGAGAVVTKDVEAGSVVVGNPAKKIGEIEREGEFIKKNI